MCLFLLTKPSTWVLHGISRKVTLFLQPYVLLSLEQLSFGPLKTPGHIPFFPLQLCIYQLVTKTEQHLHGFMAVERFFFS